MPTPRQRAIAQYMIENLTPGEIQAGAHHRIASKPHGEVEISDVRSKGTGIPASTIARIQSGEFRMGEKTVEKLNAIYRSYARHYLRESGFGPSQAKKYDRLPPDKIKEKVQDLQRTAARVAAAQNIPYDALIASLAEVDYDIDEFITEYGG